MKVFEGIEKVSLAAVEGVYDALDTTAKGLEWQLERIGLGGASAKQAEYFNERFYYQWKQRGKFLLHNCSPPNPLGEIIILVLFQLVRMYGEKQAIMKLCEVFPSLIVKNSAHVMASAYLNNEIIRPIVSQVIERESLKKVIGKILPTIGGLITAGASVYVTEQGAANKASISLIKLQMTHPKLCNNLVANDVDMFWFVLGKYFDQILR